MGRVDQLCLGCCGERGTGDKQNNQKDSGMQEKMAELKPDLPAVLGLFLFMFSCFAIFVLPACSSLSSLLCSSSSSFSSPGHCVLYVGMLLLNCLCSLASSLTFVVSN